LNEEKLWNLWKGSVILPVYDRSGNAVMSRSITVSKIEKKINVKLDLWKYGRNIDCEHGIEERLDKAAY
jgi:hypothetical protein